MATEILHSPKKKARNKTARKRAQSKRKRYTEEAQSFAPAHTFTYRPVRTCLECLNDETVTSNTFLRVTRFICASCKREQGRNLQRATSSKRREALQSATPQWADTEAIRNVYAQCRLMTQATGIIHHVDHIVPLQSDLVCGLHIAINWQILKGNDNLKKSNHFECGPYL